MTGNRKKLIALSIFCISAVTIFFFIRTLPGVNRILFDTGARSCTGSTLPLKCQKENLQAIFKEQGSANALAYVKNIYTENPNSGGCHILMHELGHLDYTKTPNINLLFSQGDTYCASGYFHGVLEKHLEANSYALSDIVTTGCTTIPQTKVLIIECYHGMGHALMYASQNNLFDSLGQCDAISPETGRKFCYFGVFMELSYSHTPGHSRPQHFIKTGDFLYPCTDLDEKYKETCYSFSGRAYLHAHLPSNLKISKNIDDYKNAFSVCLSIADGEIYQKKCIEETAIFLQLAFPYNWARARTACETIENQEYRSICYSNTALHIQRNDTERLRLAKSFCFELLKQYQPACFQKIEADAWFPPEGSGADTNNTN